MTGGRDGGAGVAAWARRAPAAQAGAAETGVSVAFTVLAMDAGPVLAREAVAVGPDVQAPELLRELFARGARLLLRRLPDVWSGRVRLTRLLLSQSDESSVPGVRVPPSARCLRIGWWPALTRLRVVQAARCMRARRNGGVCGAAERARGASLLRQQGRRACYQPPRFLCIVPIAYPRK